MKIYDYFLLFIFLFLFENNIKLEEDEIIKRIKSIIDNKEAPLLAGGLAIIKDHKTLFCKSIGKAKLNENNTEFKTATEFIKYRTASISKLFTAIGIWQLEEKGLLNVKDEASKYLDFKLRNPNFPDTPITIEMLLSHTSSIRESDSNYNIPYNHHISEFFTEKSENYYEGSYSKKEAPGFYQYVNMNYCILGTIIENVSKERFDKYMINHVLKPLNITGSFNIYEMDKEVLDEVGTIYKKLTNETFDINGKWTPKMDDFTNGYPIADHSEYIIGTNGALYGPMGNLRISLTELTYLVHMFINNGTYNNNIILKPETVEKMFKIIWKYDEKNKMEILVMAMIMLMLEDLLLLLILEEIEYMKKKNLNFSGHTANAYGLFGGVFFDRIKGYGLVYRGNGVSRDLSKYIGSFSPYNQWALDFIKLADDFANFDYPEKENEDKLYVRHIIIPILIISILIIIGLIIFIKYNKKNNSETKDIFLLEE